VCIINSAVRRVLEVKDLVVDWCWVLSLSSSKLLGVLARSSVVQRTITIVSSLSEKSDLSMNLLYALLCPLKVLLHFLCGSHAFREAHLCASQSSLSKRLQFEKFAVLSVQFARSVCPSAARFAA
jgi:hypothetical protein